jgi:hypothetical protein
MMDETRPIWPRRFPVYRFGALLLALVCGALLIRARILFAAPLERFYLRTYVAEALFPNLLSIGNKTVARAFPVAFAGRVPATDSLVAYRRTPLSVRLITLEPAGFEEWLKTNIYQGRTVAELFFWPLAGFACCLLCFSACGTATGYPLAVQS